MILINDMAEHHHFWHHNIPGLFVRVHVFICRRLEQHLTMRKCSSLEEKKFKQEVEALKKSKERLGLEIVGVVCV